MNTGRCSSLLTIVEISIQIQHKFILCYRNGGILNYNDALRKFEGLNFDCERDPSTPQIIRLYSQTHLKRSSLSKACAMFFGAKTIKRKLYNLSPTSNVKVFPRY